METKNPLIDRHTWIRLLYMVIFSFVFEICTLILVVLAISQFVVKLFAGKPFEELSAFGGRLAGYLRDIVAFLTFATDTLPFPFTVERQVTPMPRTEEPEPVA